MVRPSCRAAVTHEQRAPPAIHRPRRGGHRRRRLGRRAVDGRPGRPGRPGRARWLARRGRRKCRTQPACIRCGSVRAPESRVGTANRLPDRIVRPSPGRPPRPRAVNRPITAPASPRHGSASATPLLRAALERPPRASPGEVRDPGHLGLDPVRRTARSGAAPPVWPTWPPSDRCTDDTAVPGGERLEDVHRGARSSISSRTVGSTSTHRFVRTCRRSRSPGRSPSASCSTTPAACATSTSTRASTRRCSPSPARVWDAARSLTYVGKPYAKPGTSWHYSNTNYLVLGLVAEAVGGGSGRRAAADPVPHPARSRRHVLPGGGATERVRSLAELPVRRHRPEAAGHRPVRRHPGRAVHLGRDRAGAAGSIATTSSDLVRWARALYGGGALERGDARRDGRRHRCGPRRTSRSSPTGSASRRSAIAGHPTLGHSGRFLGARAAVRWLTDEHIAIAVITNQSRTDTERHRRGPAQARAQAAIRLHHLSGHPVTRSAKKPVLRRTDAEADRYERRVRDGTHGPFPCTSSRLTLLPRPKGRPWRSASMPTQAGGWQAGRSRVRVPCATPSKTTARCRSTGLPGRGSTTLTSRPAGSLAIPSDDVLVAVGDDDPGVPVHAAGTTSTSSRGRTRSRASSPRCPASTRARADPAVRRIPAAARHPPVGPRPARGRRRGRRPRAGQSLRRRAHPRRADARVLLPGRRRRSDRDGGRAGLAAGASPPRRRRRL